MQLFRCQACSHVLFFENETCGRCGHRLGFLPPSSQLSALEPMGDNWTALATPGAEWRACANARYGVCNWLVPAGSSETFCTACRHNRTVPDLSVDSNLVAWRTMELAKHWLFYSLLRLGLPTPNRVDDPESGLVFDFLADPTDPNAPKVMTGHDEGLITLSLAEADPAEREARRTQMHEPYRTMLGHFRHEVGHFYWNVLVRDRGGEPAFRATFGDERQDYGEALKRHYERGAPANWQDNFVSAYATAHPWEDWAETWAHYLHIVDSLETASAFSLSTHASGDPSHLLHADPVPDPFGPGPFDRLAETWSPLTIALNAMNRSMGLTDLYPFVLSPAVIKKLGFIHDLVHATTRQDASKPDQPRQLRGAA